VQNLADSRAIYATGSVVENPRASQVLQASGLKPSAQHIALRGVTEDLKIYQIP
jgi:hypothetical protein